MANMVCSAVPESKGTIMHDIEGVYLRNHILLVAMNIPCFCIERLAASHHLPGLERRDLKGKNQTQGSAQVDKSYQKLNPDRGNGSKSPGKDDAI